LMVCGRNRAVGTNADVLLRKKEATEKKRAFFGAGVYKRAAGGASLCTMSCKIEWYFGAMLLQPTWAEQLQLYPRSLEEFAKTFDLKTTVDLAPLTDAQIQGFYKDDAMAAEQMIQLRNKCYWAKKKPIAIASPNNFHKFPVTLCAAKRYHCGRHVGEHRLFGPKGVGSVPGMCGPGYGPQCDGCILAQAHVPVPACWSRPETAPAQSLTEKAALAEAELLKAELRKSQEEEKFLHERILERDLWLRQSEDLVSELEAQARAKRKREADVVDVLAGMREGRVDGSYTYVKQAAHHAKLLAVRLQEQARDMHADIVRCAVAEKELVAKRAAAEACAPDAFRCCISQDLMVDPVLVGETGHSYERAAIEQWFEEKRKQKLTLTDPKTRAALLTDQVIPNHALRQAIEAFVASQPTSQSTDDAPDEGWAVEL
jgi:hypothetical protein